MDAVVIGSALLGALALVAVLAAIALGRHLTIRVGQVHATVQGIDRAVNHRQPGEPVLVEQVDRVAAESSELRTITERTEGKVDTIDKRVTVCERRLGEMTGSQ